MTAGPQPEGLREVQDPLKPLVEVCAPDERMRYLVGNLGDFHKRLAGIRLKSTVPLEVRQQFETAKNISLYAYFAYRLHPAAESWGFGALEMALRSKALKIDPEWVSAHEQKRRLTFGPLIQRAIDSRWFAGGVEEMRYVAAYQTARNKKILSALEESAHSKTGVITDIEEPSETEIQQCLPQEEELLDQILASARQLRNSLAHGTSFLHPNSAITLQQTARLINALFPDGNSSRA